MPRKFWKWFTENNEQYLHINDLEDSEEKDELQREMITKLNEYCNGLFFEIGGHPEGGATLIITAEGDVKLFQDVKRLVRKAPKLDNWKVIAFKQPMGTDFKINYEGLEIDPDTIWFLPLKNPEKPHEIGLRIGFPGFIPEKEKLYISAIFIVLDTILGERSNAENIGYIEVGFIPEQPGENGYIELVKLPEFILFKKSGN